MPVYEFKCQNEECASDFEVVLKLSAYDTPQVCPECGCEKTQRKISNVGFILQGPGWPSKADRVNKQMLARREKVGRRENQLRNEAPGVALVPNVDGERTDSWSEAQKLAKDKGKDTKSYTPMIEKEKAKKLI